MGSHHSTITTTSLTTNQSITRSLNQLNNQTTNPQHEVHSRRRCLHGRHHHGQPHLGQALGPALGSQQGGGRPNLSLRLHLHLRSDRRPRASRRRQQHLHRWPQGRSRPLQVRHQQQGEHHLLQHHPHWLPGRVPVARHLGHPHPRGRQGQVRTPSPCLPQPHAGLQLQRHPPQHRLPRRHQGRFRHRCCQRCHWQGQWLRLQRQEDRGEPRWLLR